MNVLLIAPYINLAVDTNLHRDNFYPSARFVNKIENVI